MGYHIVYSIRVDKSKTIYTQTRKMNSAGCVYVFVHEYTCMPVYVCNNNNQR